VQAPNSLPSYAGRAVLPDYSASGSARSAGLCPKRELWEASLTPISRCMTTRCGARPGIGSETPPTKTFRAKPSPLPTPHSPLTPSRLGVRPFTSRCTPFWQELPPIWRPRQDAPFRDRRTKGLASHPAQHLLPRPKSRQFQESQPLTGTSLVDCHARFFAPAGCVILRKRHIRIGLMAILFTHK